MDIFTTITGVASILGFFLGVAATHWGRQIITDFVRGIRVPLLGFRLVRMGVYDFFDSRTSFAIKRKTTRIFEYLSPATKELGIIALSLNKSVMHQNLQDELRKLLKTKPDLKIYIFLLNPEATILPAVAVASGRDAEELKDYIHQSLTRLDKMCSTLDATERKRFHLSLYDTYVANTVLVIDPYERKGRILVENYLYKVPIEGRYSFECKRKGSPMFEKVRTAYEHFKEDFSNNRIV